MVYPPSFRRLLPLCCFGAKLQAKFPSAAHIALRFISCDAHCGLPSFDLSVFAPESRCEFAPFALVLRFAGSENKRCAQIERLTSPLTPSAYYRNDNSFADTNGRNFVFVAAIYNRHLCQYDFFDSVLPHYGEDSSAYNLPS